VSRLAPTVGGAGVATTAARWGPKAAAGHAVAQKAAARGGHGTEDGPHRTVEPRMTPVEPQQTHRVTNAEWSTIERYSLMSTDPDAAARRIMNQFGEESRIPYLNIEEGDVSVLIAFPIIRLFIASLTGVESLALPVRSRWTPGSVLLSSTSLPDHLNAWTWTKGRLSICQAPTGHVPVPQKQPTVPRTRDRAKRGAGSQTTHRSNRTSERRI